MNRARCHIAGSSIGSGSSTSRSLAGAMIPSVQRSLKSCADFYLPWDDVAKFKFDPWWKTHGYLFEERHTVRSLGPGESPSDPNALVIEVPLNQSPTELTKHVRAIIQEQFFRARAFNRKSKKHRRRFIVQRRAPSQNCWRYVKC